MNKTKKYTILFVVICFLGIGMISLYNAYQPSSQPVIEKEVVKEETASNDFKETETTSEKESVKQVEEAKTQSKSEPKTTEKTKESKPKEKNQETPVSQTEKKPVPETYKVVLTIHGIDSVIGKGTVEVEQGKSVYATLETFTSQQGIELKARDDMFGVYVIGIGGLNEKEHGRHSGWLYKVNGIQPSTGAGTYQVKDGDQIEWFYTTG